MSMMGPRMAITHTNRRGQVYFLHTAKARNGQPRWFMSTRDSGELADAIPEGYELYESPGDAQVFVRRVPRKIIADTEADLVRELARKTAKTRYTLVDVKDKAIIVYAADDDVDERSRLMSAFGDPAPASTRQLIEQQMRYVPMFRFVLLV
jgi:hypothetical protein